MRLVFHTLSISVAITLLVVCVGFSPASILGTALGISLQTTFAQDEQEKKQADKELDGRLVPADAKEVALDLDGSSNLKIVEAVAHGSSVNAGDVIVRFDTTAIDERIEEAQFELQMAQQEMQLAQREAEIKKQAAADRIAKSDQSAEFAKRRWQGFLEHELTHRQERERLTEQSSEYGLENQQDELQQLERMYDEDELVDATEEIVLKRARRRFAQSQARQRLNESVRQYTKEFEQAMSREELELRTQQALRAHERTLGKERISAARAESDMLKKQRGVAKKDRALKKLQSDREQYVVRAKSSGVVLHGAADALPGEGKLESGSSVNTEKPFVTVAQPGRFKVVSEVPESLIFKVQTGKAVRVTPEAAPSESFMGALRVSDYPTGVSKGGNLYEASVTLPKLSPRFRAGMRVKIRVSDRQPETAEREVR